MKETPSPEAASYWGGGSAEGQGEDTSTLGHVGGVRKLLFKIVISIYKIQP